MAVFADGNHQRLGINRAAASLGLRLPDDVSVVGFGDLPFVDWVTPRLTTVRTPLADMTVRATRTVLLLSGLQPETAQAEVTIELVVRDSGGPPPVTGRAVERSQGGARVGSAWEGARPEAHGVADGPATGAVAWRSSAAQPAMLGWEFESRFHQCVGETREGEARCRPDTGPKWRRHARMPAPAMVIRTCDFDLRLVCLLTPDSSYLAATAGR